MAFVRFGLIVTGRGEAVFLPGLFRSIMSVAHCTFVVLRKSEQLNPITSERRQLRMVGRGQVIPTIDQEQYGLPALAFMRNDPNAFVIVVDDLEGTRRHQADAVFARYRAALDGVLAGPGLSKRAAVHFLVNMLEAYYFAHSQAVNDTAGWEVLPCDHADDVEMIGHPKNHLKSVWGEFDEIEHGKCIIEKLDVNHVLHDPIHCCWLRTLFAWCVERVREKGANWNQQIQEMFQLHSGCRSELTANQ